jgi:N-acetylneuraminate lyase
MEGILPALVTPIADDGSVAVGPLEKLLERLYSAGVHGMYVCGQTGEGLLQTAAMRKTVAEAAVRCSPPGASVIVHVGAYRPEEAIELARHAAAAGAHAISSLPPLGAYSFAEIRQYYERLARASDLPLLVYFFPEVCPAISSRKQLDELLAIPGVVGLKYTDFDLFRLSRISLSGKVVFNGRDEVLAAGLLMGAHGGIGSFYNITPELFLEVWRHARAGNWAEARRAQDAINELIEITLRFPIFPALKRMLTWAGIDAGRCLAPRRELTPAEEAALQEQLRASRFAGKQFAGLLVEA